MTKRLPLFVLLLAGLPSTARISRAADDAPAAAEPDDKPTEQKETEPSEGAIGATGQSIGGAGISSGKKRQAASKAVATTDGGGGGSGGGGAAEGGDEAPPALNCVGGEMTSTTRAGGKDEIDMSQVTVVGGGAPADAPSWKRTAKLTLLHMGPGSTKLDFTKKDGPESWPEVPVPGWNGGAIQYTLWVVVRDKSGQWLTTGVFEYWRGDVENGGNPSGFRKNGYYFTDMRQPKVGEKVGFFLTSGDQRRKDVHELKERTNVVLVPFPNDCGHAFSFN